MTETPAPAPDAEREALDHLIRKCGYWYRPNRSGYTSLDHKAGRYTRAEAEREAAIEPWKIQAVPVDSLPEDSVSKLTTRAERAEFDAKSWRKLAESLQAIRSYEHDASLAELARLRAENAGLREALEWYEPHLKGCRLIHSGGDQHRAALDADGGRRARAALSSEQAAAGERG